MKNKGLHPKNLHKNGYNLEQLIIKTPNLEEFIFTNKYGNKTIDFSNPKAVKTLNAALLSTHYNINHWNFPDENLCPPIPGRVDYIHHLADLISLEIKDDIKILDIGTGASCIYPLLGISIYNWDFVATDIDINSLDFAQDIIDDNSLTVKMELRQQLDENHIL